MDFRKQIEHSEGSIFKSYSSFFLKLMWLITFEVFIVVFVLVCSYDSLSFSIYSPHKNSVISVKNRNEVVFKKKTYKKVSIRPKN